MKNTLIILILLFSSSQLFSQKVKLKDIKAKANYCELPSIGLPSDISTYHIEVISNENSLNALDYTIHGIKTSLIIPGYIKSDESVGAKVSVSFDGPSGTPLKLNTQKKKNKEGKEWNEYSYSVNFTGKAIVKISDESGKVINEFIESFQDSKSSATYRSTKELKSKFNSNKFYISNRKSAMGTLMSYVDRSLKSKYGYSPASKKVKFKTIKNDKHPDYKKFSALENDIVSAFENMNADDNSAFIEEIQPAIDFWTNQESEYDGSDKHQKKLKYTCLYNAALAYYYAEDLENALKYATMVSQGDFKKKEGKKLIKKIDKLKEDFNRLGINTQHIKIELSEADLAKSAEKERLRAAAIESGDIQAFPSFNSKMGVKQGSEVKKGSLYNNGGGSVHGYFVYEDELNGRPDFRKPRQLRFGYLKDGEIAVGTTAYAGLDSMLIDGTMYHIMDVTLGSGIASVKLENAVVEMLESYDRTFLGVVFPPFMKGKIYGQKTDELTPELVIIDKEKGEIFTTKVLLGGVGKAMKKIVKSCPASMDYIEMDKKSRPEIKVSEKMQGFQHIGFVSECLRLYDSCD